ncbi:hypothetical protein ABEB36_013220 [Hypothenemus hampei]|uniref:TGF-beta propeptide domain-containing protein n=1 Tax=Hypothenemus hampei TaxID=57062 RepID=A0ABD1E7F9_HYPHA
MSIVNLRSIFLCLICVFTLALAAPSSNSKSIWDQFLTTANDNEKPDVYDQPQEDQPPDGETSSFNNNLSDMLNNKGKWVRQYIKYHVLNTLGRDNSTIFKKPQDTPIINSEAIQMLSKRFNQTLDDDLITEKMRGFYPSCETTANQEQEWKDSEDLMNLYFDLSDYDSESRNSNIASATLRLYRLPQNSSNSTDSLKNDCKNLENVEEEKLIRVSAYWYFRLQKKRRAKPRLADSKMFPDSFPWIELSVKPATRSWSKTGSKTLTLGILVEDQEGKPLRAEKYFKGASCTVGVSTPIPLPTVVRDAIANQSDGFPCLLRSNSTRTVSSNEPMPPTIDICYLEFPENTDISQFNSTRIKACNLRKMHEENQRQRNLDFLQRLAALPPTNSRHIRHQKQHKQNKLSGIELENAKVEDIKFPAEGRQMSEMERAMRKAMSNSQIYLTREEIEDLAKKLLR